MGAKSFECNSGSIALDFCFCPILTYYFTILIRKLFPKDIPALWLLNTPQVFCFFKDRFCFVSPRHISISFIIGCLGGFIFTFSLLISLSIILQTSKFMNQFTISWKYFDMACRVLPKTRDLFLSLLRFSEMTSKLIIFNHLRCHSSSTALRTRSGYWKPTQRCTDETHHYGK